MAETGTIDEAPAPNADARLPVYEEDLFSPEVLRHPFEHYRRMRELGPVVRLREPDLYVLSRFDDVQDALRAADVLISGEGVGFSHEFNVNGADTASVIQSDGELHRRLRTQVLRPLNPAQLAKNRQLLRELIGSRVRSLVDIGPFDAMKELAPFLPVQVIGELVGLPEEGRAAMLKWAAASFNAVGPSRDEFANDFQLLKEARRYLERLDPTQVREGSWARSMFDAVEAGKLTEKEARGALSAYVLPSLDTTILAKGHLLYNLARCPEQWRMLRQDPARIPAAVLEGVRHSSVLRWFSRVARAEYRVDGCVIPPGARVMLIYASANRDERRFADPDSFDLRRDAQDHLAWGTGPHMCAGRNLAKLEMEVMLEALIEHCEVLKAGEPEILDNRGLYGFAALQLEFRSAPAS